MAEKALTAVIQEAYIQGISTRSPRPGMGRFASVEEAREWIADEILAVHQPMIGQRRPQELTRGPWRHTSPSP